MRLSLTRKVKAPVRAHPHDAGIDFFVPEFNTQFITDLKSKNVNEIERCNIRISSEFIMLEPHGRILIPAGVHVDLESLAAIEEIWKGSSFPFGGIESGIALLVHNKSGVGSKKGLDRLAEVIDQPYQGEIHLSIVNTGTNPIKIEQNDKLVQMLLVPVFYSNPEVVPFSELYSSESDRGTTGFGDSDKKDNILNI